MNTNPRKQSRLDHARAVLRAAGDAGALIRETTPASGGLRRDVVQKLIDLDEAEWVVVGEHARLKRLASMPPLCPCNSGQRRRELRDARGIFCTFVCDRCEKEKRSHFRPEIFTDANYAADEPIEEE